MQRINTFNDAMTTGEAELDVGDGLRVRLPLGKQRYTIDQSAGRVVKIWDYLNNREQLIYGDTGIRNINAVVPQLTAGNIWIVRNGNMVSVTFADVRFGTLTGFQEFPLLPVGFRPGLWQHFSSSPTNAKDAQGVLFKDTGVARFYLLTQNALQGSFTYYTNDPWPTSLPGTAVGSIPS